MIVMVMMMTSLPRYHTIDDTANTCDKDQRYGTIANAETNSDRASSVVVRAIGVAQRVSVHDTEYNNAALLLFTP
jgi:hypothetical protein